MGIEASRAPLSWELLLLGERGEGSLWFSISASPAPVYSSSIRRRGALFFLLLRCAAKTITTHFGRLSWSRSLAAVYLENFDS